MTPDDARFCSECGSGDLTNLPDPASEPAAQPFTPPQPAQVDAPPQFSAPAGAPAPNAPQSFYQQAPAAEANATGGYYAAGNTQPGSQQAANPYPQANGYQQPGANQQPGYQQQGYQQPGYQQPGGVYPNAGQPNYTPAPPVKKKKTGLIIAIVLGVLFLLFVILVAVGVKIFKTKVEQELDNFDPNEYVSEIFGDIFDEETEEDAPAVPYTEGTLTGNVYTNEWAGLCFTIPEGFKNGSSEDYEEYTDERTDAALICAADNDEGELLLLLEDVSDITDGITEEEYLDIVTDDWVDEEDEADGWTLSEYYWITIGGERYLAAKMSNDLSDFVQMIATRNYDNHMVCFLCWGEETVVDSFLSSVTVP